MNQRPKGRRLVHLLGMLVILAFFALAGYRFMLDDQFTEVLGRLRYANPAWPLAVAALYLASCYGSSTIMRLLLLRLGYCLTGGQVFITWMVKMYGNLLVSKAGTATAAGFMKMRYGVAVADFASTLMATTVLQFLCIGLVGLVGQAFLAFGRGAADPVIAAAFALSVTGSAAMMFLRISVPGFMPPRMAGFWRRLSAGWDLLRAAEGKPVGFTTLILVQVMVLLLRAGRLWLVFVFLGTHVDSMGLLLASLLGDIGLLISVTPMGLGFRETAIGYGARLADTSVPAALSVTLADRAIWSLAVLIVAQIILLAQYAGWGPSGRTGQGPGSSAQDG